MPLTIRFLSRSSIDRKHVRPRALSLHYLNSSVYQRSCHETPAASGKLDCTLFIFSRLSPNNNNILWPVPKWVLTAFMCTVSIKEIRSTTPSYLIAFKASNAFHIALVNSSVFLLYFRLANGRKRNVILRILRGVSLLRNVRACLSSRDECAI